MLAWVYIPCTFTLRISCGSNWLQVYVADNGDDSAQAILLARSQPCNSLETNPSMMFLHSSL